MVRVFEVDEAENRLVLSARELLKEQLTPKNLPKHSRLQLEAY